MRPLAALILLLATTAPPELAEVPTPALENQEAGVQEQLRAARESFERALELEETELAAVYGDLGGLYLAYDLVAASIPAFENAQLLDPEDFRWPYFLAVAHAARGDLEQALAQAERALELEPRNVAALVRRGRAELDLGHLEAAEASFRSLLELDGTSAAAHEGLGQIAAVAGDHARAAEHFERALELQPRADSLHYRLALELRELDDLDGAREHLEKRGEGFVGFPDPLMRGLARRVRSGGAHLKAGNRAAEAGDLETARREYRRAVELQGDNSAAHYNLGRIAAQRGEDAEAIGHFERALELQPDYRDAHFNLGTTLARLGRLGEAAEHFAEAHRIDPRDRAAHLEWALTLAQLGETERATAELARALESYAQDLDTDPRAAEAQARLAALLGQQGRFEEAAGAYSRLLEADPSQIEAHFARAMALILGERYTAARGALEESFAAQPQSVVLAHLLARFLATAPDPAARDGERALELARAVFSAEQNFEHAETLAMALAELGRFEEAADWQRQIVERAERQGAGPALEKLRRRLESYRRGEPCRAPWKEGER